MAQVWPAQSKSILQIRKPPDIAAPSAGARIASGTPWAGLKSRAATFRFTSNCWRRCRKKGNRSSDAAPQGEIDFQFRAEWTDPFQPRADVTKNIRLKNCAIQYVPFPYPLHHVNGLVSERNGHWTLQDIQGLGGDETTVVICRGTSTPIADGCHVDLNFRANNVQLDDNLKRALEPPAQRAWDELQPQGRIDLTAHVVHETGRPKPTVVVTLQPRERTVSIQPLKFPYRFEQVEGAAKFEAGRVELADVRARHDRVDYSAASGTWQPRTDGGWQLDLRGVNADRFMPYGDRDLLVALPPTIADRSWSGCSPVARSSVYNSSLSFAKSPTVGASRGRLGCESGLSSGGHSRRRAAAKRDGRHSTARPRRCTGSLHMRRVDARFGRLEGHATHERAWAFVDRSPVLSVRRAGKCKSWGNRSRRLRPMRTAEA